MGVKSSAEKAPRHPKRATEALSTAKPIWLGGTPPAGRSGRGKPTPSDDELIQRRNDWAYLLEANWGRIGWQLECARSVKDIRAAFQRIAATAREYLVAPFVRISTERTVGPSIRKTKKELGEAVAEYREADGRLNALRQSVQDAERAVFELSDQNREQLEAELSRRKSNVRHFKSRIANQENEIRERKLALKVSTRGPREALENELGSLQTALAKTERECGEEKRIVEQLKERLDKITPEQVQVVAETLSTCKSALPSIGEELSRTNKQRERIEQKLLDQEADFCQHQLLRCIGQKRYRFNPLHLANALAGLPDMGYRQSAARCSKKLPPWKSGLLYRVFEFVEREWRFRNSRKFTSPVELFRIAIMKLSKRVIVPDVGRRENEFRRYLADNWMYFRLAIQESLLSKSHPRQFPYVVLEKFTEQLGKPRTAVDILLAHNESLIFS